MDKKDIISNCRQLEAEIQQATSDERNAELDLSQIQREIQQLENAKIATRLEFGSATDFETVRARENALLEINRSIDDRKIAEKLQGDKLAEAKNNLSNLQSTFNSLGCRNII